MDDLYSREMWDLAITEDTVDPSKDYRSTLKKLADQDVTPSNAKWTPPVSSAGTSHGKDDDISRMSSDEVRDKIRELAKEENDGEYTLFVLNIGSALDRMENYVHSIAITEFVQYALRRALGEGRIDYVRYDIATKTLQAAGIRGPGFTDEYTKLSPDQKANIEKKADDAELALLDLYDLADELKDTEQGNRLLKALTTLQIEKPIIAKESETISSNMELRTLQLRETIDMFQRFLNLSVDGKTHYEISKELAEKVYNINENREIGFAILAISKNPKGITEEELVKRSEKRGVELTAKIHKKLQGFINLERLSLSINRVGDISVMGYVPTAKKVVAVDVDGTAKLILDATTPNQKLAQQFQEELAKGKKSAEVFKPI